ncbi:MAG: SMP-30/gluconolactonase/LRE family protein [Puniceicoccaceae bacterium]
MSCPNFADQSQPGVLVKVTSEGKVTKLAEIPLPEGGDRTNPMGIAYGEDGALYVADTQGPNRGRLLRMVFEDDRLVSTETVAMGMQSPNGVRCRDGAVYVTQPVMPQYAPGRMTGGVYRFAYTDRNVAVSNTREDTNLVFAVNVKNQERRMGLDGLAFDKEGNLFVGNLGDGTIHKLKLDDAGEMISEEVYAQLPNDAAIDGMCMDADDNLYCAAFAKNRLYRVSPKGEIKVLAEYPDNDGANGELDQPADLMVYEGKVVISNFDLMSSPGMVNSGHSKPYTLSYYELDSKD